MNVEWLLEEAQDYLLSLRQNEEEEGESLYLDEEAEAVKENLSEALIELSAQYEQLASEQETLQFQSDELDVQLEEIEPEWSEEYEREVCLQIAQLQQQNRKHVVQVQSSKDQLRKLLATKADLARELEDLRSKEQFFQRKTELNRKSIEKVNKQTVKTLSERMRIDELTKAREARTVIKRAQLRTLNEQHKQYEAELIEMQRILKELTELYMEKRKECQAEQSVLLAKGLPYTDRLPKRLAHSRQNSAGTDTFREAA